MKRLYLLRHAKSDRGDPAQSDAERGLSKRGRRAATALGRYMRQEKLIPALVLSSTARRTIETWELLAPEFKADIPLETSARLYLASPEQLLKAIRGLSEKTPSILLLGHNPGIQVLATNLADGGDDAGRRRMAAKYPTGGLAVFDFAVDHWADIGPGMGKLERFIVPRNLD